MTAIFNAPYFDASGSDPAVTLDCVAARRPGRDPCLPTRPRYMEGTMTDEMTYEESIILKWYRARKDYKENPWTYARETAFQTAEELLVQIGMDLNTKDA